MLANKLSSVTFLLSIGQIMLNIVNLYLILCQYLKHPCLVLEAVQSQPTFHIFYNLQAATSMVEPKV